MFHVVDKMEPPEERVVERALNWLSGVMYDAESDKAFELRMKALDLDLFIPLGKQKFVDAVDHMVDVMKCREYMYSLSDYHFLILYHALKNAITAHNNAVLQGGDGLLLRSSNTVDFKQFQDLMFWDTYFLFTQEEFAELTDEQKKDMEVSDQIWSIVHRMCPHPDELIIKRAKKVRPQRVGRL